MMINSAPTSGTHRDYLKQMLLTKFLKKYGDSSLSEAQLIQLINSEVVAFMKTEKLNRESLKAMEARIEDKLQKRQDKRVVGK